MLSEAKRYFKKAIEIKNPFKMQEHFEGKARKSFKK